MSSTSAAGVSIVTLQFGLGADARRRRAGGAGGDQRRRLAAAGRPAGAAGLRQGQPGRRAGADAGDHLRHAAADRGAEPRQHAAGAEDQPGLGRRPGHAVAAASGRRCASRPTRRRWRRTGIGARHAAHRHRGGQRQQRQGQLRRPDARLHDQRQRPAADGRRLPQPDRRLSATARRCACPTSRSVVDERRERASSAPGPKHATAGDHPQRAAPARRQRDRHRRRHQGAPARAAARPAGGARGRRAGRPHDRHPRLGAARARSSWCWRWCWWCW